MPLRNSDSYFKDAPPNFPIIEYPLRDYGGTIIDCYKMLDFTEQELKQLFKMGILSTRLDPELLDYCMQLCFCIDHKDWAIKIKNAKGQEKICLVWDYIEFADNEKQSNDDYTWGSEDNYDSDDSDQKKKEEIKKEKKQEIKKEKKHEIKKKTIEKRSLYYHIIFVFLLFFCYLSFPKVKLK